MTLKTMKQMAQEKEARRIAADTAAREAARKGKLVVRADTREGVGVSVPPAYRHEVLPYRVQAKCAPQVDGGKMILPNGMVIVGKPTKRVIVDTAFGGTYDVPTVGN